MAIRIGKRRIHFGFLFDIIHSVDFFFSRFFKPRNAGKIKKVAVFRADRLGDAFVCLPLFIRMNECYDLTVYSSPYSDFVFKKAGLKTVVYDNPAFYKSDSRATMVKGIVTFNLFFPWKLMGERFKNRGQEPAYDLFVLQDLSPIRQELTMMADSSAKFLCSSFFGYFLLPLVNLVVFRRYHFTESKPSPVYQYLMGIRHYDPSFLFLPRPDALDALAQEPEEPFRIPFDEFLVFHVGGKENRLICDDNIVEFLDQVDIPIVVIDDQSNSGINRLKTRVKGDKIHWLQDNYELFEYLFLILDERCLGYIGYDGGHSHLLGLPKTSLTIYTMGEHSKWRPYTASAYSKIHFHDGVCLETSPLGNTTKMVLYRDLQCNPCFYHPCSNPLCRDISLLSCWDKIRDIFKKAGPTIACQKEAQ